MVSLVNKKITDRVSEDVHDNILDAHWYKDSTPKMQRLSWIAAEKITFFPKRSWLADENSNYRVAFLLVNKTESLHSTCNIHVFTYLFIINILQSKNTMNEGIESFWEINKYKQNIKIAKLSYKTIYRVKCWNCCISSAWGGREYLNFYILKRIIQGINV